MQVGTTKDQVLYSKSSAAVHPGALAAATVPQYNTIQWVTVLLCKLVFSSLTKKISQNGAAQGTYSRIYGSNSYANPYFCDVHVNLSG